MHNLEFTLRHLSPVRCQELCDLLCSFPELFGDAPSCTDWVEHDINVGDTKPIKQRFCRVAPEKRELMEREIKYMQDHNIAVPSFSDWASPCILVGKSDGTVRFCMDFREVIALTKPAFNQESSRNFVFCHSVRVTFLSGHEFWPAKCSGDFSTPHEPSNLWS